MKKYLLLLPFFLSFFVINNSYAVSDITVTYQPGSYPSYGTNLFPTCYDSSCMSQYHYLIVQFSTPSTQEWGVNTNLRFFYSDIGYKSFAISTNSTYSVYDVTFRPNLDYIANGSLYPSDVTYTFTLTDHLGESCPEPEEPEPCPVVPDAPYSDKFDNIEKAIYVCGAILIMLYFFYCIYRMIIKGSGVN